MEFIFSVGTLGFLPISWVYCLRRGTKNFWWRLSGDKSVNKVILNGIQFSVGFLRVLVG